VIIVTGRMFQSVRRYALEAELTEPVVCYQGAVVADPVTGEFLRHVTMPLAPAREAIEAIEAEGFPINVYIDDELYVTRGSSS
jgi:hydroxymethylpyrimidine pyrophosphatase-like HAD family hydrolase